MIYSLQEKKRSRASEKIKRGGGRISSEINYPPRVQQLNRDRKSALRVGGGKTKRLGDIATQRNKSRPVPVDVAHKSRAAPVSSAHHAAEFLSRLNNAGRSCCCRCYVSQASERERETLLQILIIPLRVTLYSGEESLKSGFCFPELFLQLPPPPPPELQVCTGCNFLFFMPEPRSRARVIVLLRGRGLVILFVPQF